MKIKFSILCKVVMLALAVGFAACEGDKGDIGPIGNQGDTGSTGATGANGIGFDELTQYGKVTLNMSGKRADDINFNETMEFIYMPVSGVSENSVAIKDNAEGTLEFMLGRENKGHKPTTTGHTDGGGFKNNIWLDVIKNGDEFTASHFVIFADILTSDFKTFTIDYNRGSWDENFIMQFNGYNYDPATGKLKLNFTYIIPGQDNSTEHDITLTGTVDVTVYETI